MSGSKIRVLHIVNNLHYGGMERVVAEITRRTDRSRFDTHLLALRFVGHFGEGLDDFATLHVARAMSRWSLLYPRSLADQIISIGPDVVHLHSGVWYKASAATALAEVKYQIFTDHGRPSVEPWLNRIVDKRASGRTDVIVCVSSELRERLAKFVRYPSRLRVIHNGVDTECYAPKCDDGEFRTEIGVAADVPIIGSIGRLEPVKGYEVLVDAFARLLRLESSIPKPVLVIVGDGSQRSALEAAAAALGIAESVHFMGWRGDIERITRAFTVFTMSSHSEGTSVSLLESMSAGLCPVVTDVGGNAAVLGPELKHRLVRPADSDALALALSDALRDSSRTDNDAKTARQRVLDDFDLDSMVRQYEELYSAAPAVNLRGR